MSLDKTFNDLILFITSSVHSRNIPLFKIGNDNTVVKCSTSSRFRVLDKVLNVPNLIYYSKKSKSYYTFIGLI